MSWERTNEPITPGRSKSRYFYGWNVVAASFLAHLSYAEHHSSMLGFFLRPLQNEFGWSRSALAAVQTIARLTEGLVAPVVGPLVDRYGPRVLMPIGAVIVGLSMLGVTQINAIWQFYLLRGFVVAIGFTPMGGLVTQVAVSNWFIEKRGRAIAISRAGGNLSNIIFVPITVFVIAVSGWRTMFVIFAVVTWLVVLLPSVIFMRRRPEDLGLYPDGAQSGITQDKSTQQAGLSSTEASSVAEPVWSRREVLTTGSFWLLTACLGVSSMSFQGINISLAPYIQDLNYSDTMVATILTFRAILMVLVLPIIGFLAEYSHRLSVRVAPFICQTIGVLFFLLAEKPVFLWLAVAAYGLGMSGVGVTVEVVWADYFGRLSLGLVRSLAYLIALGFGAAGPLAMNAVFDVLGSYRPAFMVIAGLFVLAAVLMGLARRPKASHYATAAEMAP